jgi:hypothetical protein
VMTVLIDISSMEWVDILKTVWEGASSDFGVPSRNGGAASGRDGRDGRSRTK